MTPLVMSVSKADEGSEDWRIRGEVWLGEQVGVDLAYGVCEVGVFDDL